MMKIPILVLAFKRSDHASEAMKAIRRYQTDRLYLECDGARQQEQGEKEAVDATRKAMNEARQKIGNKIDYANNLYDTVLDADALFHVTEWKEFRMPSWKEIKRSMKENRVLIDGRNVYYTSELESIEYIKIG